MNSSGNFFKVSLYLRGIKLSSEFAVASLRLLLSVLILVFCLFSSFLIRIRADESPVIMVLDPGHIREIRNVIIFSSFLWDFRASLV